MAEASGKGALGKVEDAAKNAVRAVEAEVKSVVEKIEDEIKRVLMVRDPSVYDAPHVAEVHPAEIDNMRSGGWITQAEAKAAADARAAAAEAMAPAEAPKA